MADSRQKLVTWGGIAVTILYIAGMFLYSYVRWTDLWSMEPHDFADFLAGIFGPPAFLWVVLGYHQQGLELRHSTEELRNSVEQQKELVKAAKDQAEADKIAAELEEEGLRLAARPHVRLGFNSMGGVENGRRLHDLSFVNEGPACNDFEAFLADGTSVGRLAHFPVKGNLGFQIESLAEAPLENVLLRATFVDRRGKPGEFRFMVEAYLIEPEEGWPSFWAYRDPKDVSVS